MAALPAVLSRVPRHPGALVRERLTGLVDGPETGLVVVAPAGWGKTMLAGQLADRHPGRLVWCRLAPGYDQAHDLVALAAASAGTDPPSDTPDAMALAGELLDLLEAEPTVLVIDDYHRADHPTVDALLAEVLPLLTPESTIVVTSRTRPAGLIGRLPGGLAKVVEQDELAFTTDEARALLETSGRSGADAPLWTERLRGWPAALGLVAEGGGEPTDEAVEELVDGLLLDGLDEQGRRGVHALAVLPYLTPALADELALGGESVLDSLGQAGSLVSEADGYWRIDRSTGDFVAARVDPDWATDLRRRAAAALAATDPPASIDLHLSVDDPGAAADVLAANLSAIGVERAVMWLYQFPAELRRRFPPVVAAGRATVNVDVAAAEAARRVDEAESPGERRESLLALGSTLAAAGDLSGAAEALEGAIAAGVGSAPLLRRASELLARVRWWLGDDVGARSALDASDDSVASRWLRAQLALTNGDVQRADAEGRHAIELAGDDPDATTVPGQSARVQAALLDGDGPPDPTIRTLAEQAHAIGIEAGGHDLTLGAVAQAWCLIRSEEIDAAQSVCDAIERRAGRQDAHARLQAALIRLAAARAADTDDDLERLNRRVGDARRRGFAPVEELARRALPSLRSDEAGLRVELLGEGRVAVDGAELGAPAWKSKKALEVLRYVADAGPRGRRREEIIEAVWPDRDEDKGRTLLRTALSGIRRTIEPSRPAGEPSRFVETSGERVSITADTDLARADRLTEQGRLEEAFRLLQRPATPLEEAGEWATDLRRAVERTRVDVAQRLAGSDTAPDPVKIAALEMLLDAEPWNRAHVDALMGAHRSVGDKAAVQAVERRWFEADDEA